MHQLLAKQLADHLGDATDLSEEWKSFLKEVDRSYRANESERTLLKMVSQEMKVRNKELQDSSGSSGLQAIRVEARGKYLSPVFGGSR